MEPRNDAPVDVALIGGGIMSATLAVLLTELDPSLKIHLYERLEQPALESSDPWRNAGTGHAALCELNYTPQGPDGSVDIAKAVKVNEQFGASLELWRYLESVGAIADVDRFLHPVPHMTFVRGTENVEYLRRRYEALDAHPRFAGMEFSTDPAQIGQWAPLLMDGRTGDEAVAATRATSGTDVDFGSLTRSLLAIASKRGVVVQTSAEVRGLRRSGPGWQMLVRDRSWMKVGRPAWAKARFVFVGAGGGALRLLQSSRIPEIRGYAGFPISGQFLRTFAPPVVERQQAKIYGKADVGAPPMSVPHLDTRVVGGRTALMFGPFAGFSIKLLAHGSQLDAFKTIRPGNIRSLLGVARDNLDLVTYLLTELAAPSTAKLRTLRAFYPEADPHDWQLITAGQRVQVIKPHPTKGGTLEFGTEVIASADGTIAGLLGASPGASTAAYAMATVIERCFGDAHPEWVERMAQIMPSLAGTAPPASSGPGTQIAPDAEDSADAPGRA